MQLNLLSEEIKFFRDLLRNARYAALADSESFQQICFAIESLGRRLDPNRFNLGGFYVVLHSLASKSKLSSDSTEGYSEIKSFDTLFCALKDARNDAMHTGAYARNAVIDAVLLCLILENALLLELESMSLNKRLTVGDFMVSAPVVVHPWNTVEYARQLMLLNSFSYLPIWFNTQWWLISDIAVAKYLRSDWASRKKFRITLEQAHDDNLMFNPVTPVDCNVKVEELLEPVLSPGLWLVKGKDYPDDHLVGVLSPFELI